MKTFTMISSIGIPFDNEVYHLNLMEELTGGRKVYWLLINGVRMRPPEEITNLKRARAWQWGVINLYRLAR